MPYGELRHLLEVLLHVVVLVCRDLAAVAALRDQLLHGLCVVALLVTLGLLQVNDTL